MGSDSSHNDQSATFSALVVKTFRTNERYFEGRGWQGLHHHATPYIAAHGILVVRRLSHGGSKKPRSTRNVFVTRSLSPSRQPYERSDMRLTRFRLCDSSSRKQSPADFSDVLGFVGVCIFSDTARLAVKIVRKILSMSVAFWHKTTHKDSGYLSRHTVNHGHGPTGSPLGNNVKKRGRGVDHRDAISRSVVSVSFLAANSMVRLSQSGQMPTFVHPPERSYSGPIHTHT